MGCRLNSVYLFMFRQRHFFEQRRQQRRSELSEIPVLHDTSSSSQQEAVSSLDIASLKNLSRLARTERDNGNGKVNASGVPYILSFSATI